MKTKSEVFRFVKRHWSMVAVGLALTLKPDAVFADIHLDMLKTRTDCFTNVTVCSQSKTEIFIRHSGGIANIKLENLAPRTIAYLNSGGASNATSASTESGAGEQSEDEATATGAISKSAALASHLNPQLRKQLMSGLAMLETLPPVKVNPTVIAVVLGALFAAYLFLCYCLKLICQKTGNPPGFLIWLPVFQMIPLLRAASMSGWWFLGLFVPVINLIIQIVWCFKIVQARGKSVLAAIGLLLPVTNLGALLYLAFSDVKSEESSGYQKVKLAAGPLAVEA